MINKSADIKIRTHEIRLYQLNLSYPFYTCILCITK